MIDYSKIDLKGKTTGEVKTLCPSCSEDRKNKKDPCLRVNIDKKVGKCYHCGDVTFIPKKDVIEYKSPPQTWQNFTGISDKMVKWLKESRGISQQTLIDCKVTEEKFYQPAKQKEVVNIVFNYFEGDKLVNKKYRSADKKFTQVSGAKKILYGINDIIGETEAYIVEGEFDKLAMWEAGIKNCVSVPNGANDLNNIFDTCEDYLKNLEKIYIAVDMDEAGQKLEKELIKRFGKWKCEKISFKGKDANDDLKEGVTTLMESIESASAYPVDGTFNAEDIQDDIYDLYENGLEETIKPKNERFTELGDKFGLIPGQLTVVTGIPSHGKSNFIEDYALNLVADCGLKASFFSPEHFPLKLHQSVMIEKVMGKPFYKDYEWNGEFVPRVTKNEIQEYIKWSKDKVFLTYPEKGDSVDWKWLLGKFKEQMFRFGVDIFVIDAFNKVKRDSPDSLGEINQVLSDLTSFAQGYGVHVILIAHPTKMQKNEDGTYKVPDLYSVKGSGDFRDQAHNGITVYRHFPNYETGLKGYVEVHNLKTKFKHQGEIGSITEFEFDGACNRYFPKNGKPNRRCLFKDEEEKVERTFVEPNLDFDTENNFNNFDDDDLNDMPF
jgi:twinkle protein